MNDVNIAKETVTSLAAKIDALDLDDAERSALDTLFVRAADADAEVEGFGVVYEIETKDHDAGPSRMRPDAPTAAKLSTGLGFDPVRLGVWTDMRP